MTFLAGSPCAKTVCFAANSATFLPRPAESRKNFRSNAGTLESAFLGERGTLTDTRRTAEDNIRQNSMKSHRADCPILNSTSRAALCCYMEGEPSKSIKFKRLHLTATRRAEPSARTGALPRLHRSQYIPASGSHS